MSSDLLWTIVLAAATVLVPFTGAAVLGANDRRQERRRYESQKGGNSK